MSIVISILIFCLIIIIHEIGHFSAAKLFKMRVYEFSIGMGPSVLKKRGKETDYNIKLIPFGGSVQLGEDEDSDDTNAFRNKPVWQRMIVILAGAFLNLVLGVVLCLIIAAMSKAIATTTIGGFREGASSNGVLQAGDKISAINGMSIFTTGDIQYQIFNKESKLTAESGEAVFDFTVIRNGKKIKLENVTFQATDNENGGKEIYLDFFVARAEKNFTNVVLEALKEAVSYSRLIMITLIDVLKGTYGLNGVAGPIGTVSAIGEVTSSGFSESLMEGIRMALYMAALITINVGIFNLLPIPALDGARFLFFIIEAIRRKPVKAEIEGMVHFIGFAALMLFMLIITFNDIRKLFTGGG